MSTPTESREEAIERLTRRASELEAATAPKTSEHLAAQAVTSQAYKIIAELLGGVFLGLGLGFGVDRLFGTNPWGLISGVLLGFALSLWMARRTANRLMAQAKAAGIQAEAIPFEEAGEED